MKDTQKPKESSDSKDNINSKYEGKTGIILGTYNDLPDYYKDNEYIRKGYLLYCDSIFQFSDFNILQTHSLSNTLFISS